MSDATLDEFEDSCDVAIVGMSGRFPGSPDVSALWRTVSERRERISFFADDELEINLSPEDLANPAFVKAKGVLEDVEMFDASFFNISARMAEWMDPQQRIFLECAWSALEDAGYDVSTYERLIAVYAGASTNTYILSRLPRLAEPGGALDTFQLIVLNDKDHLATRAAYKLNLRGRGRHRPDRLLDLARRRPLRLPELARAGSATWRSRAASRFRCRRRPATSTARATVALARRPLPRLRRARARHRRRATARASSCSSGSPTRSPTATSIHAVIKGSAINNDGPDKVGYTAPSVEGQAAVIARGAGDGRRQRRHHQLRRGARHGHARSATRSRSTALTQAFRRHTERKQFCALGSVKTNIGHLDAAAGVAGLIKTALALKHGQLPPSLHFERPNPDIDFENSPFYVNRELLDWPRNGDAASRGRQLLRHRRHQRARRPRRGARARRSLRPFAHVAARHALCEEPRGAGREGGGAGRTLRARAGD